MNHAVKTLSVLFIVFLIGACGGGDKETETADTGDTANSGDTGDTGNTGSACGDGVVDEAELCDSNTTDCADLDTGSYIDGTAECNNTCDGWLTDSCISQSCGDDEVTENEVCDGDEIACDTIENANYVSGTAVCKDTCDGYNESECLTEVCGDGEVTGEEVCDTDDEMACTDIPETGYDEGTAVCNDTCDGWMTDSCVDYCGNDQIDEGEICEIGESTECNDIRPHGYKLGETLCLDDCSGWDETQCEEVEDVPVYGFINNMVVDEPNIADAEKIYPLKDPSQPDGEREFDAQYVLNHSQQDPTIVGGYANNTKQILTKPGSLFGFGQKRQIVANKGIDPLPEKFFTLFASIEADSFLELNNIHLKGPQVVLMFNAANITIGDYLIGPTGPEDVVIAIGEEMPGGDNESIDLENLCIAAVGFESEVIHPVDTKMIQVVNAFNPMQDGGGGAIAFNGHDIPLYHPTETPIGDVSEFIIEYGLENICPKIE